jgi:hypothetical protein
MLLLSVQKLLNINNIPTVALKYEALKPKHLDSELFRTFLLGHTEGVETNICKTDIINKQNR